VFGVREAAWPAMRADLGLTYVQVGLLLGLPTLFASVVEPVLGVLGDVWHRRRLILLGGLAFGLGLLLVALAGSFGILLAAFLILYPASGAFVSLSQATLMDGEPARQEQNMARWALFGAVGAVGGPLLLAGAVRSGAGWRPVFAGMAALGLLLVLIGTRVRFPSAAVVAGLKDGLLGALAALRRGTVLRWLALLELSDLMLDVLGGFLALYLVDEAGFSISRGAVAVTTWTASGLLGGLVVIRLLERRPGLRYVRLGAAGALVVFPAFLTLPDPAVKLTLLGLLGLLTSAWYPVLKGGLYSALPGRSGTAMAASSVSGLVGGLFPVGLGVIAQTFGLEPAMWLLLVAPMALLLWSPLPSPPPKGEGEGLSGL
jgi:FSR family fosmidomycin resistance protein-like MFS transporter